MKKTLEKIISFKNNRESKYLVVFTFVSLFAGLHLLIDPDSVKNIVIRAIGFIWVLEAFGYASEAYYKYLLRREIEKSKNIIDDVFIHEQTQNN